ncbi:MAG: serine hydrolase domain-containing protein, partial [Bacteroidota bacterium]
MKEERETKSQKIVGFINKAMDIVDVVPGLSISVIDKEGLLLSKGFGYADLENSIPASNKTNFYIASTTKSFVGLLGLVLHDEGLLNLDRDILELKPFSKFERQDVFQNIKVRDLLTHQTGIDNGFLSFRLAYTGDYTNDDILRITEDQTFLREEGKEFEYTNFGYYLYGLILKEELGKNWQDLLEQKIFNPLNMENASGYISKTEDKYLAFPYHGADPWSLQKSHTLKTDATMHPAGGLMMNANDVSKFLSAYVSNDHKLGKSDLLARSYKPYAETGNDIPV